MNLQARPQEPQASTVFVAYLGSPRSNSPQKEIGFGALQVYALSPTLAKVGESEVVHIVLDECVAGHLPALGLPLSQAHGPLI